MTALLKVLFICSLGIFALTEVNGKSHKLHRRHDEDQEEADTNNEERGLLDFLLLNPGLIIDSTRPQQPIVRPPNIFPAGEPLAPTVQLPASPVASVSLELQNIIKPGLLGTLLGAGGTGLSSHEKINSANYINMAWVRYALQKCNKINPLQLTVILPTTTNKLGTPKIYYFENSTGMAKSWHDAQAWCSARGMDLVTVNDENENLVLKEKIKQIFAGSAVNANNDGSNAFWIGLNNLDGVAPFTYIGDSTGTRTDWHTGEPSTAATDLCVAYSQRTSADNIAMDAKSCSGATGTFRYICEVSDECTALLMSRYRNPNVIRPQNIRPLGGLLNIAGIGGIGGGK